MKFKVRKQFIVNKIYWLGLLGVASTQALSMNPCLAQSSNIVTDDSLGNETSQIENNSQRRGLPVEIIRGGAERGINLFHSFQEFNVSEGRGSYFFSPNAEIQNIFTRVTGSNRSEILGTLGTFGNSQPNLFLINPNGILFGENASLDVQGSFVGTTANGIGVDNQDFFNLLNSQPNSQLLTVKPSALFFNQLQGGNIETSSAKLNVPDGRSLLLVGGDIKVNGGSLRADGGRIDLAGLAENGAVELTGSGSDLSLTVPENVARADISLGNRASIDVHAAGGGSIAVNARNLEVAKGSQISAGIRNGLGSPESVGGDIKINATDKVIFDGQGSDKVAGAFNEVRIDSQGKAGDVEINTGSLSVLNGARVSASTNGIGDAGSVQITATGKVIFDRQGSNRFTAATSQVDSKGKGKAGDVKINASSLFVLNGAQLSASTRGIGDAGSVKISAREQVIFDRQDSSKFTGAFSQVRVGGEGNAGGVQINTGSLSVLNGAQISASTIGIGNAGSVEISANNAIFDRKGNDETTGAFSQVDSGGEGNAGGVQINVSSLSVLNGARVSASTRGIGDAGSVEISATNVIFDRKGSDRSTGAFSQVESGGKGKAGGLQINTGSLSVLNGAQLSASTFAIGDAGSVEINATDQVIFDGQDSTKNTGVFSQVRTGGEGNAGGIQINTDSLSIFNGAQISTGTRGTGDAGSIEISAKTFEVNSGGIISNRTFTEFTAGNIILNVTDNITLTGSDTGIFANTTEGSTGKGGSIIIDPKLMTVKDGAAISVDSDGEGIGGDIELAAGFLTLDNGTISAETRSNTGGNVTLNLQDVLLLRNNSQISSTAGNQQFGGDGGDISINSPFIVALPKENSDITANAFSGSGGNVKIESKGIFGIESRNQQTNKSDITASSNLGVPGNITLNSPDNNIQDNLTDLPSNQIDTNALIANSCIARGNKQQENSFTITGSGGLRNNLVNGFVSQFSTGNVRNVEQVSRSWKKGDAIVEPTGAYRLADGRLMLGRVCDE